MSKLEIYQDKSKQWRWRRKASNGKIIGASSESYKARKDCEANANRTDVRDKWEFYKDKRGQHRWRRKAFNGSIVGAASEGFKGKAHCQANAKLNGWKGSTS